MKEVYLSKQSEKFLEKLNPDPSLEICLVRLNLETARLEQCF